MVILFIDSCTMHNVPTCASPPWPITYQGASLTGGLEGVIYLKLLLDEAGQGTDALLEDVNKDGLAGAVGVVLVHEGGEALEELPDGVAFGAQGRVMFVGAAS